MALERDLINDCRKTGGSMKKIEDNMSICFFKKELTANIKEEK